MQSRRMKAEGEIRKDEGGRMKDESGKKKHL
jgi:hypothetical protein